MKTPIMLLLKLQLLVLAIGPCLGSSSVVDPDERRLRAGKESSWRSVFMLPPMATTMASSVASVLDGGSDNSIEHAMAGRVLMSKSTKKKEKKKKTPWNKKIKKKVPSKKKKKEKKKEKTMMSKSKKKGMSMMRKTKKKAPWNKKFKKRVPSKKKKKDKTMMRKKKKKGMPMMRKNKKTKTASMKKSSVSMMMHMVAKGKGMGGKGKDYPMSPAKGKGAVFLPRPRPTPYRSDLTAAPTVMVMQRTTAPSVMSDQRSPTPIPTVMTTQRPSTADPTTRPSPSRTLSPTTAAPTDENEVPSVQPSTKTSSQPTLTPSEFPSPFPSIQPTLEPTTSTASPTQECTGPLEEFTTVFLFDLEIPPTFFTPEQLDLVASVLQMAYQNASGCDTPGAFVNITQVHINLDTTDANGDLLDPMPWVVEFDTTCRGCQGSAFSDQTDLGGSGGIECNCDLPTVDAYVEACNDVLANTPIPTISSPTGGTFTLGGGGIFFGGGAVFVSTGNTLPLFTFDTVLQLSVRCPVDCSSYNWAQVSRGIQEVYNQANANNPKRCDPDGRVVNRVNLQSVSPTVNDQDGLMRHLQFEGFPFTIVFTITATCRGSDCNSQAVLFGNHQPSRERSMLDISTFCPETDIVGCPTTNELTEGLEEWLNNTGTVPGISLQGADEVDIDSIPVAPPTRAPTTLPTQMPSVHPSATPTLAPSTTPTRIPSTHPSEFFCTFGGDDCPEGQFCSRSLTCVDELCLSDDDCPAGFVCTDGICQSTTCSSNADCTDPIFTYCSGDCGIFDRADIPCEPGQCVPPAICTANHDPFLRQTCNVFDQCTCNFQPFFCHVEGRGCFCDVDTEGSPTCLDQASWTSCGRTCFSSAQCNDDERCVQNGYCCFPDGRGQCVRKCDNPVTPEIFGM